jgi:methionine-rich copper-binding protein CopC
MRFLTALLAGVVLLATGGTPAFAHAGLVSSDPPSGALLLEAPSQVSLTFNENLLETLVNVSVINDADEVLLTSVAEAAGPTVIVGWPADATDGTYRLAYRVVSADGHPVTGEIQLTIDATATPEDVTAAAERATQSSPALPSWVLIVGIGLLAGIAIGLFTVALRRKRA